MDLSTDTTNTLNAANGASGVPSTTNHGSSNTASFQTVNFDIAAETLTVPEVPKRITLVIYDGGTISIQKPIEIDQNPQPGSVPLPKIFKPEAIQNPFSISNISKPFNEAMMNLETRVIAKAPSQDLPTLRATLFTEFLNIVDKPAEQRTAEESKALEWLATQVKNDRIETAQKALDFYQQWQANPWQYRTPAGFGLKEYNPGPPPGGLSWMFSTPNPPEVRQHATAVTHQELFTTGGVTADKTTAKALARYQQGLMDYQSSLNLGAKAGLTGQEIQAITAGGVLAAGAIGTTIAASTITGASLGAIGAAIFPTLSLAPSTVLLGTAVANGSVTGVTAGTAAASGAFAAGIGAGVTAVLLATAIATTEGVNLFGSTLLGVEGKVNLPNNLRNELQAAKDAVIDIKKLIRNADGTVNAKGSAELYTAFLEATRINGVYLTDGNDTYTGTVNNDELYGLGGNDTLFALGGNDFIDAGKGNDVLYGGEGNDRLDGDEGNDQIFGENGNDTLYGLIGDDTLAGGAGDDVLAGEAGNDTLTGGLGNDGLNGGNGYDIAVLDGSATDYQVTLTDSGVIQVKDTIATNGDDGTDLLIGVEQINFSGGGSYSIATGTTGNDTLTASAMASKSLLFGGAGNDLLKSGTGNNTLNGSIGNDTVFYEGASSRVTVDLATGNAQVWREVQTVRLVNVGGQVMGGSIQGGSIRGGFVRVGINRPLTQVVQVVVKEKVVDATDSLSSIEGVIGSNYDDILTGSTGNDTLSGGAGNDILTGGNGSDILTGGAGADKFVFNSLAERNDIITDFNMQEGDKIQINGSGFGATSTSQFTFNSATGGLSFNGQQFATLQNFTSSNPFVAFTNPFVPDQNIVIV